MSDPAGEFEVTIDKVVYGGDGLAFHEGRAVFVPFAAPGDRLRVQLTDDRKDYLRASIRQILVPSDERRDAPCPYFGRCGGCQLQHLSYPAQLRAKEAFVRESLARIAKLDWSAGLEVISGPEWGYRPRSQFQVECTSGRPKIGYYEAGSHLLCEIDACPLLTDELNACLSDLRGPLGSDLQGVRQIDAVEGSDGTCISSSPGGETSGSSVRMRAGGCEFEISPGSFFQGNRFLLDALIARVVDDHRGRRALDLFCGVGFFTLPLASRFEQVMGIEEQPEAVQLSQRNATLNRVKNCRFVTRRVEDWLAGAVRDRPQFDLVVVDPPRSGLSRSVTRGLGLLAPPRLVYVSCNPATFARDVARLRLENYRLVTLTAVDLFPQTFHVEVIGQLVRY